MDAQDLFKKLTTGAKFNLKKYMSDAEKLKIVKKNPWPNFVQLRPQIKDEKVENCSLTDKPDDVVAPARSDPGLTLLGSIKASDNIMNEHKLKKKKQKNEEQKPIPFQDKTAILETEEVQKMRNYHRISVKGHKVPPPLKTFEQLQEEYGMSSVLLQNLQAAGYKEPTPIQMQAIPIMLQGRQILACAPTGSGKTAAFLVPIIHHLKGPKKLGFRAVIVSPTRELAKQTYRECHRLAEGTGLRVHIISKTNQAISKFGPQSSQKFDVLVTTPNRLIYLLQQDPPALNLHRVEWLVIDESDKLFEAGPKGFREQLAIIYNACDSNNVKRVMFSATHTVHVARWARKNLKGLISVTIGHRNTASDYVDQELVFVGSESGKMVAFRELVQKGLSPPVLIFVQTKERAKELFSELIYDGINVDVIHADRTQLQRDNVVRSFREGKIWVLICTELMGRGIDFKGVNLVLNYDFPPSAISYIHRIGRTGRAGRRGKAVTFFTEDDTVNLRSIAHILHDSGCSVPEYMLKMKRARKQTRRTLEQRAPKRESISTVPVFQLEKDKKRKRKLKEVKQQTKAEESNRSPTKRKKDKQMKTQDYIQNTIHRHEGPVICKPLQIIHLDKDILVINKPASVPVHPCGLYRYNSVLFILAKEYNVKHVRSVHRLDRLTSGLLIFGRTKEIAQALAHQIRNRQVKKEYVCRVEGEFPDKVIECGEPIEALDSKIAVGKVSANGKPSLTVFKKLSYNGKSSVLLCKPTTGRMHQIRIHLQFLGYPIVNDSLYNHQYNTLEEHLAELSSGVKRDGNHQDEKSTALSQFDEHCCQCKLPAADPHFSDLIIYLHAWKYEGKGWSYKTELPDWAQENWDYE